MTSDLSCATIITRLRCAANGGTVTGQPTTTAEAMRQMHPHLRRVFTRSTKVAQAAARQRRVLRARYISMAIFTVVLAVCAGVVEHIDVQDGHYNVTLWGVPVFSWLLVGALVFPLIFAAEVAVFAFVWVLEAALSNAFENVHYILMGLRTGLWCAHFNLGMHEPNVFFVVPRAHICASSLSCLCGRVPVCAACFMLKQCCMQGPSHIAGISRHCHLPCDADRGLGRLATRCSCCSASPCAR